MGISPFGYRFGTTTVTAIVFATANVVADVWKGLGLIIVAGLLRERNLSVAGLLATLWVVALCFGVASSMGVYVQDRTAMVGGRERLQANLRDAERELADEQERLRRHGDAGDATEIEAAIEAMFAKPVMVVERVRGTVATMSGRRSRVDARTITKMTTGTLRWLCVEYYKSAEFDQLAPNTQRARRLVFEGMLREAINPNSPLLFADCPVAKFQQRHVRVLRDRKKNYPEAANIRLKSLRGLFNWATENAAGGLKHNPTRDIARLKVRDEGYHSWTEQERAKFEARHAIGSKARLAYALLFHTGQRRSDVVRFGRQHVHAGKLRFTQQKNRRRKPIALELPILPELQRVIDGQESKTPVLTTDPMDIGDARKGLERTRSARRVTNVQQSDSASPKVHWSKMAVKIAIFLL